MTEIPPNQTLYIRNLTDKLQKDVLKHALYSLCIPYGRILDIVVLKTMKMRGQAFIVFSDVSEATVALRQLNGRCIFGKSLRAEYALSKSDVVAQMDGTFKFGEERKHMSAEERKRLLGVADQAQEDPESGKRRQRELEDDEEDAHVDKRQAVDDNDNDNDNDDDDEKDDDDDDDDAMDHGSSDDESVQAGEDESDTDSSDDDEGIGPMPPGQN